MRWNLKDVACLCLKGVNMCVKEIMRCKKAMPEYKGCTCKEKGYCGHPYSVKMGRKWKKTVQRKESGNGQWTTTCLILGN